MSVFVTQDIESVKVDVVNESNFEDGKVDIKIIIDLGVHIIEAYDTCDEDNISDYVYSHLRDILDRPRINDTGRLMRYLFNRVIKNGTDGMFYYPYWQFVDDKWSKREIKNFEKDFNSYRLEGMIEYDFDNQSEVVICYRDFIKHFVQVEIVADLPF